MKKAYTRPQKIVWTLEQSNMIRSLYLNDKLTTNEIGIIMNVSGSSIILELKRQNIPRTPNRKYKLNETVFADPTNPEAAYWAGFIMADGNISAKQNGRRYVLFIELSIKDIKHLEKLQQFLQTDKPIYRRKRISFGKEREYVRLEIVSKNIYNDLNRIYGITENKSFDAKCSVIMESNRYFWLGMIDGDGHISKSGKHYTLGLVGSKSMMKQYQRFVQATLNKTYAISSKGTIFSVGVSCEAAIELARHLYAGYNGPFLLRKFDIIKKVI